MAQAKFYIGRRYNPQLKNPYFRAFGRLTKKAAREHENSLYGGMVLTAYDTAEAYEAAIREITRDGFRVYHAI